MVLERPAPGSHDRAVPSGSLEESSARLFEAALAAQQAEREGDHGTSPALDAFYRVLADATLLFPVPPEHGVEAREALETALGDETEVQISVMLASDGEGRPTSVCFGSLAALAAWSPTGSGSLPIPGRIALRNLAAAGLPAILDPAGPVPYRFEPNELAELAAGRLPGSGAPLTPTAGRTSIRLRLPGPEVVPLERQLAAALSETRVESAWLVESATDEGWQLLVGLVGPPDATAEVDVPDGTQVQWLREPLLSAVRAVNDPFYHRRR